MKHPGQEGVLAPQPGRPPRLGQWSAVGLICNTPGANIWNGQGKSFRSRKRVPYKGLCEIAPQFSRGREDDRPSLKRGTMKLKNRDWTDGELRLKAVDTPLLQQDRVVRASLLAIVIFGVAALAGVVSYLAWPTLTPGL